jgi:hypothetical protein
MRRIADLSSCQHERRSSCWPSCFLHIEHEQEVVVTDIDVEVVVVDNEFVVCVAIDVDEEIVVVALREQSLALELELVAVTFRVTEQFDSFSFSITFLQELQNIRLTCGESLICSSADYSEIN